MYMDREATISWATEARTLLADHPAIVSNSITIFVLPTFPLIGEVRNIFTNSNLLVGSQNLSNKDFGAMTGEVSPVLLKQLGCEFSAVGHYERRTLFSEEEGSIAEKVNAAYRNNIIPVICIGEIDRADAESTELEIMEQMRSALSLSLDAKQKPTIIAYEPSWAIGAKEPAPQHHINRMCAAIRKSLLLLGFTNFSIIYGGSAGPGTFTQISENIDGLFLGRMAHDPKALEEVVTEIWLAGQVA